jgi:hypothetical protein
MPQEVMAWEKQWISAKSFEPTIPLSVDGGVISGEEPSRQRWIMYDTYPSYGRWPEDVVHVEQVFPFNIGAVLAITILLNVFTYLISVVYPRKLIDPMPLQLKQLLQGSEMTTLTACCKRTDPLNAAKRFVTEFAGETGEVAVLMMTEALGGAVSEAELEKQRVHKAQNDTILFSVRCSAAAATRLAAASRWRRCSLPRSTRRCCGWRARCTGR